MFVGARGDRAGSRWGLGCVASFTSPKRVSFKRMLSTGLLSARLLPGLLHRVPEPNRSKSR